MINTGSSADLEELQRKALFVPLSSLSGLTKIGEGVIIFCQLMKIDL